MRGYPDSVSEPGPKSVPTKSVSASFHETSLLASGSEKPPETNTFAFGSNSRTTLASAPPRDRETRHFSYLGWRKVAPSQTQFSFSASARTSRSRTVSHFGSALRY